MGEIIKLFYEEVREKKKASSGAYCRASRRGFVGNMRTPYSLLKGAKAIRNYQKNSEVEIYMKWEREIIPFDEWKAMEPQQKRAILHVWEGKFSKKEIADTWGIKDSSVYYYYKKFKVATKSGSDNNEPNGTEEVVEDSNQEEVNVVSFQGKFSGTQVHKMLSMFEGDSSVYNVSIVIKKK